MSELLVDTPPAPSQSPQVIRDALMESRQRWRHLVGLAGDLAFETDVEGRFVLLMPDTVLGWPADALIGQPSDRLLGDDGRDAVLNPFRPVVEIRRHCAWLRRSDGRPIMMAISSTQLQDAAGQIIGARGIGIDITDCDARCSQIAGMLRREEVLHYILSRVNRQIMGDAMMETALTALVHALSAEGAAVIGAVSASAPIEVLHEHGSGAPDVLEVATPLVKAGTFESGLVTNPDGRLVLAAKCATRAGVPACLVLWRDANARPWDQDETALVSSAVCIVRMVLDCEALRSELVRQARTDPLTGLLNRRAFIEEMRRQMARLDREVEAGTLMFVDIDSFKAVNDRLGHAMGDQLLVRLANILRNLVRPFDVVTRLGGDEFAVWLSGADHLTAAERADYLCKAAPGQLQEMLPEAFPRLGVSVGIATRRAGSQESIEDLTKRADMAMYEVKRSGRRHWRVSLLDGD
jgi:diguanylate cyclase (GGDEF)-like protein/PAS domain S-box-containing protein